MIDLLLEITQGTVTITEGEILINKAIDDFHNRKICIEWWQFLGFDKYEMNAYAHGGTLEDLLSLRTKGWPEKCAKCGNSIDYHEFGWKLIHVENNPPSLQHIICPAKQQKS